MPDLAPAILLVVVVLIGLVLLFAMRWRRADKRADWYRQTLQMLAADECPRMLRLVGPPPDLAGVDWCRHQLGAHRAGATMALVAGFAVTVALLSHHDRPAVDTAAPDPVPAPVAVQPAAPATDPGSPQPTSPAEVPPPSRVGTPGPAARTGSHYVGHTARGAPAPSTPVPNTTAVAATTPSPPASLCQLPCALLDMLAIP